MGTEIHTFYSLKEIHEFVKEQVEEYKNLADDYGQWLGSFLRDYEETLGDQEWFKNLAALQKNVRVEKRKKGEKKGKGKKKGKEGAHSPWIPFKELMLCASEQGEAEILFDALEKINKKIEQLEKIKSSLEDLENIGLGKEVVYITYINEGVPEKIVLRHKKGVDLAEKFKFITNFTVPNFG